MLSYFMRIVDYRNPISKMFIRLCLMHVLVIVKMNEIVHVMIN